jgi:PIN domain nuclease of toxin-antitoxin system
MGKRSAPVRGRGAVQLFTCTFRRSPAALDLLPLNANHKDPFDRMLVAQATSEGMILLTADGKLGGYGLPNVRVV